MKSLLPVLEILTKVNKSLKDVKDKFDISIDKMLFLR